MAVGVGDAAAVAVGVALAGTVAVAVGVGEAIDAVAVAVGVLSSQRNTHVKSATGPLPQLKAPARIRMVLLPAPTGVVLKWNTMVMSWFCKVNAFAGMQFTRKAFALILAGSAA